MEPLGFVNSTHCSALHSMLQNHTNFLISWPSGDSQGPNLATVTTNHYHSCNTLTNLPCKPDNSQVNIISTEINCYTTTHTIVSTPTCLPYVQGTTVISLSQLGYKRMWQQCGGLSWSGAITCGPCLYCWYMHGESHGWSVMCQKRNVLI